MRLIAVAMLSAALGAGCSPDRVAAPSARQVQSPNRESVAGEEFVTTGGATTEIIFKKSDITNRLSFVARHEIDGITTDGEFEYTGLIAGDGIKPPPECKPGEPCPPTGTIETEGEIHGVVTCFTLTGKGLMSASIEGVITHASNPKLEGLPVFWDVTDNGEGADAPPDKSSTLVLGKTACLKRPILDQFPVESGNVQVHPAQ
jgi:hypothetical protein